MSFAKRARDNYFTLNGRSSADWGIVVSKDNGFDAPERDVSAIEVPGRNGELHIDNGRWRNIDVTYNDCVIERDFTEKFGDFRAYCARQRGYQRLEDTFHPDEYRLADMTQGIKVSSVGTRYNSGKFDLTFNCKPQRFLKSGEEPIVLMNWADCSTNDASDTVYYGKSSANIGIKGGTGHSIHLQKTDASAQNLTVYVTYWNSQNSGVYEDPVTRLRTLTYNVTNTITIADRTGVLLAEWITVQFITQSDDSLNGWDISIDFTDDDGNSVHGIFADSVDLINPTGFTTKPLIISKCPNNYTWALFFPGIAFSFENEQGDFVEKYKLTVEYETEAMMPHGSRVFIDCENQYVYCREEDSTTESGYKYYPYTAIEMIDSATGQWMNLTFPALEDTITRISYPTDEVWGSAYSNESTQPYELLANGDMYKAIYPRWYTI